MEEVTTGVSPGVRVRDGHAVTVFWTGTLSTLLFRWPAERSLDPLGFFIGNLWLYDTNYVSRSTTYHQQKLKLQEECNSKDFKKGKLQNDFHENHISEEKKF